ncbi:organomercurial lyase [uncultured Nocardioides sp.]|uniref:organomercurial lyase n=1 Tax=uncultured Nocardioides sp. TaxID=198441 RepID=UPI00260E9236|nr:organomercurial lyase [uncultured Nocardioides sp.]
MTDEPQTPTSGLLEVGDADAARVRRAAFTRLLATAAPVPAAMLATEVGLTEGQVEAELSRLAASGAISRDDSGAVVAAGGLSVTPARHQLLLDGHEYWTWCAFDGIGIPAALELDAVVDTRCPTCGGGLRITITGGNPPSDSPVVGWLPGGPCINVQADFCPDAKLFCTDAHLATWRQTTGDPPGTAAPPGELAETGRQVWADLARLPRQPDASVGN